MNDFSKLDGLIAAITAEQSIPSPSHSNLARLTSMALEEIKSLLSKTSDPYPNKETLSASIEIKPESQLEEKVKKRRSKRGSS